MAAGEAVSITAAVAAEEEEKEMDDGSTCVSLCASIFAQFPFLQARMSDEATTNDGKKLEEIRICLDGGNGSDQVNLWHLRQVSLTKGGFVSSQVRKRAWPKLTGAHQQVLMGNTPSNTSSSSSSSTNQDAQVEITQRDMVLLQQDIAHASVWNIEDHIVYNRLDNETRATKKVAVMPGLQQVTPTPSLIATVSETQDSQESSPLSPLTTTTLPVHQMYIRSNRHRASLQEQRALQNTLVSVLRTTPTDQDDERYRYYHGLHDLTSLLLINLESPSLTVLILKKLATHSLYDFLSGRPNNYKHLEQGLLQFMTMLLSKVDYELQQHIHRNNNNDCMGVALQWIPSWFASHFTNVHVASRLLDVLLVSHATMPIYLTVAILCLYRNVLLSSEDQGMTLDSAIHDVPSNLLQEEEPMSVLEEAITKALEYIRLYPPPTLYDASTLSFSTLRIFQEAPEWQTTPTAPTDWTLLQQAKALRRQETPPPIHGISVDTSHYPLASVALGLSKTNHELTKRHVKMVIIIVVVLLICCGGGVAVATSCYKKHKVVAAVQQPSRLSPKQSLRNLVKTVFKMEPRNVADKRNKFERRPMSASRRRVSIQGRSSNKSKAPVTRVPRRSASNKVPTKDKIRKKTSTLKQTIASKWNAHDTKVLQTAVRKSKSLGRIVNDTRQDIVSTAHRFVHGKKNQLDQSMIQMQRFVRDKQEQLQLFWKETAPVMAKHVIVESDKLRWKGQRFLL